MCQDGGMIWECDQPNCGRAVCSVCVEVPDGELHKLDRSGVKFTCVRCHWRWKSNTAVPYVVSAFSISFHVRTKLQLIFLQGFTINDKPVLSTFLKVRGAFETAIGATVHSPPTILLHLRHHSITNIAHFTIVGELLSEYYPHNDNLKVLDMPFNAGHDQAAVQWNRSATDRVAELSEGYSHVIVFVTTHSVPNNGDLWLGQDKAKKEDCATPANDVSVSLFINSYQY